MKTQTSKVNLKKLLTGSAYIMFGILTVVFVVYLFSSSKTEKQDEDPVYQKEMNAKYAVYVPVIPDAIDFAGEKIPIELIDVRESLDYEILKVMFWHSEEILHIKRSRKLFPIIEPILAKNNIPDDFKYLAVAESGLRNVVSPAKAHGYWQFLKETGKSYGLEINSEVDERYDLEKSTEAACKYLQDAYDRFGSWTLAAAAYNAGQGRIKNNLKDQNVDNYYDILLNKETGRYVYRIVAHKLILSNPRNYGFVFRDEDLYKPIETSLIEVDSTIADFVQFAKEHNTNYKIFKRINPSLRKKTLTNKERKTYYIHIPTETGRIFKKD